MKRTLTLTAAAAAAAATLLTAGVAHADPNFTITANGVVVGSGGTSTVGQDIVWSGTACLTPGGQPGYTGAFWSSVSDPATDSNAAHAESITDGTGGFSWDSGPITDAAVGTVNIRWYCATAPVAGPSDPNIQYSSPLMSMTIAASGASTARLRTAAASKGMASQTTTSSSGRSLVVSSNPDSLPTVDRIAINGPRAAQLKHFVDAIAGPSARANLGHNGNVRYVDTAIGLAGPSMRNKAGIAKYVAELDAGQIRVKVVEDIALTSRTAAQWNR